VGDLMEVGQIRPGTVVGIPPEVKREGFPDLAVFAGANLSGSRVYARLNALVDGKLLALAPKAVGIEEKWAVYPGETLRKNIQHSLKTKTLKPPEDAIISGSDPEIFVTGGDGQVIPAWKFLKDKKSAINSECFEPFWDGFQAEFCPIARQCLQQHMDSMQRFLDDTLRLARKFDPKAKLSPLSTIQVADSVMQAASDEEVRFRCTPSLNVYRDPGEPTPDPREYKFRFAGGHLHAGFGSKRFTAPVVSEIIRALDGILGLAGVSLAANVDTPERRKMYGRAGEFRLPKHGIEYRVLSNFWLRHPALAHLVFELFRGTINFAEAGLYAVCWEKPSDDEIREIINNNDVVRARKILAANQPCIEAILGVKFYPGREYLVNRRMTKELVPLAIKTILNGLEVVVKEPDNLEKNWYLGGGWNPLCGSKGASWASIV